MHYTAMPYIVKTKRIEVSTKFTQARLASATHRNAASRFTDRQRFVNGLKELGFAVLSVEDKWKFTHIRALKTEQQPQSSTELRF